MPVLPLLHKPPVVASVSVADDPTQAAMLPPIATGAALTVNAAVARQPVGNVYVIVAVPGVPPVTVPDAEPMFAVVVLLLVHAPPAVASASVVVSPVHICGTPLIADGNGLTVTMVAAAQPLVRV
jgi:hypothetical protein